MILSFLAQQGYGERASPEDEGEGHHRVKETGKHVQAKPATEYIIIYTYYMYIYTYIIFLFTEYELIHTS